MRLHPLGNRYFREEDADSKSQLAVGGDIENKFGSGSFGVVPQGGALADKVILIDVSLGAGIGLQATDCHRRHYEPSALVCRRPRCAWFRGKFLKSNESSR